MAGTEITPLKDRATQMRSFFEKRKPSIEMSLAKAGVTADRVIQALFTAGQKTPDLFKCTPQSVYKAILLSAQSGLIPDGITQHAHLIPRKNKKGDLECNLQIGYRGLLVLCRRSGQITVVKSTLVRLGDKFKAYYGTEDRIEHEPLDSAMDAEGKERPITHCYAVATFKEGHKDFELMSISEVELLRKKAKAFSPAWDDHYGEMVKKTVLRRLAKRLPQSEDLARLLELDSQAEQGVPQGLGDEGILDLPEEDVKVDGSQKETPPPTQAEPQPKATPSPAPAEKAPAAKAPPAKKAEKQETLPMETPPAPQESAEDSGY